MAFEHHLINIKFSPTRHDGIISVAYVEQIPMVSGNGRKKAGSPKSQTITTLNHEEYSLSIVE